MRCDRFSSLAMILVFTIAASICPTRAEAGSFVIPAWAFDRGNGRIYADPDQYADAGAVVGSGERQPWGWSLEYDIDVPVTGVYRLHIRYAAAESRPIEVYFDTRNVSKCCIGVSMIPGSSGKPTWNSSGARWELLRNRFGGPAALSKVRNGEAEAGKHTLVLTSRNPLPHFVSLRVETAEPFPEDWQPPEYKVRDLSSVPEKYHGAFNTPINVDVETLRQPVEDPPKPRVAGSLAFPAWAFDRGNVRIYASPDEYANAEPLIGSQSEQTGPSVVEYDVEFPVAGEYTLTTKYASPEARPLEVFLDGKSVGWCCNGVAFNSPPYEVPMLTSGDSWDAELETSVTMPVTEGKHTLKLARDGLFPHLVSLKLETPAEFPKDWKQPQRVMRHLDRVPATHRSVFLPPDAVNMAALRLAIEDAIETYGPAYPDGEKYLKRLAEFEKKPHTVSVVKPCQRSFLMARTWAGEENTAEEERTTEEALKSLRREAMLAHPALKFDKLLFIKRNPYNAHIYEDHHHKGEDSNIYLLSPVAPDGKVTKLVPELDGGLFGRFDLSFDATKLVFCYKKKAEEGEKKPNAFHIYEIRLDPSTGLKVPGSLRQLTFSGEDETEAVGCALGGRDYAFHDTDPCYLPNGKIIFVSARSQRNVFCFGTTVSSLHIMDADGKNLRCISQGPLTEMGPTLLSDGRVVYTRWEYIDKGLGNGQGVWAVRPDGSGVDHIFKNSTMRPSGMIHTRAIPNSPRFVTVANPHCGRNGGAVILIDNRRTRRSAEAMTCITPEIGYPCMYHSIWHMGYFLTPYPFSEQFFLVSHVPGSESNEKQNYGIYVLDAWGNRALLYGDPEISCFEPMPLRPRQEPGKVAPTTIAEAEPQVERKQTGTVFIQDIYEGMTGIERGRVKYVRVMGALPWPWNENGIFRIGHAGNVHRKKIYGVAKVHEDGSACFEVPAEENVFFQALDENYMQLQHMPTFINMKPGENRSCIGCHEHRRQAPSMAPAHALAMNHPVQPLVPQPGDSGPRMVHYDADVQPVLDRHCVGCHGGSTPAGRLDLTGVPTETWNRSYENLMGKGLVSSRQCGFGRSGYRPLPPLSFGSHLSKLAVQISTDTPCNANVSREELIRIVTWIDANAPYYGTYRGKRDLEDRDDPDFRALPLVVR